MALAAAALAPRAAAAPGLLLGVDDDSLKWYAHTGSLLSIYRDLGLGAVRVTLDWSPGESFPVGTDRAELQRAAGAGNSIRVVLAVTGPSSSPPLDAAGRASYCGFVSNVLARFPSIRDVAIWTEPNSSQFWRPQKGAAAAYEALLAQCWDVLHAIQPGVNVIATSAAHAKPARWYANLGEAYRASAQDAPDLRHARSQPVPEIPRPRRRTPATRAARSTKATSPACSPCCTRPSTARASPFPARGGSPCGTSRTASRPCRRPAASLYSGVETDKHAVSEAEQAAQLTAAVELAYCQPAVGAFFNFELRDESSLSGWQSGLVRPDWSAKPAFVAYLQAIAAARSGAITCASQ